DSFKESMSALEAANAIEQGFKRVFNQDLRCVKLPMADTIQWPDSFPHHDQLFRLPGYNWTGYMVRENVR
ncbi:hypothetical protein GLV88_11745, partial [Staphylococcus hyicus]|nr:hypothetical protein [Staphylococcus hyicus]